MKRKLLALFLVLSMCVGIFAGCSNSDSGSSSSSAGGGESSTADTSSEAGSEASTGDTAGKQTDGKNLPELTSEPLNILVWGTATEEPSKSQYEGAIARFMEDYPNITIELVNQQNDNYKQQLVVAMSSGQCPDMYQHWGGGPMAEYYESGFVNDITEMYNTYDHPAFIEASIAQSTYEDKILAIPFGGLSGCDIFYNKTIFEEVGVEVPETIDELEAVCDKLLEAGYTPFSLANSPGWTGSMYFMYLVARHSGNDEFDAAYTQEGSFTSDAWLFLPQRDCGGHLAGADADDFRLRGLPALPDEVPFPQPHLRRRGSHDGHPHARHLDSHFQDDHQHGPVRHPLVPDRPLCDFRLAHVGVYPNGFYVHHPQGD